MRAGTLVFATDVGELDAQSLRQLLERMDVAVLLVRDGGQASLSTTEVAKDAKENKKR
ncbi:MAG TPA: hypothetical protein VI565_05285 [Burkholderiales bacterium]|nr:hypothetical protein [Burkholderiales bacterium]